MPKPGLTPTHTTTLKVEANEGLALTIERLYEDGTETVLTFSDQDFRRFVIAMQTAKATHRALITSDEFIRGEVDVHNPTIANMELDRCGAVEPD